MKYQSSRGRSPSANAAEAIKMGIAPDGGLFVPEHIPQLSDQDFQRLESMDYRERAGQVLARYLEDFSAEEIEDCVAKAYNAANFDNLQIAPLVKLQDQVYILELWHGPTCAFKDMALQILPHLVTTSMRKTGENSEIIILVATSGDTGKAALQGFADVRGTRIVVFFPDQGVSEVQKRQMLTQEGNNVYVAAVRGNFDDAQSGVKDIFANQDYVEDLAGQNMKMSSANSINWGRLLPQIVYYISAYVDLRKAGGINAREKINIVVPTGNFGNILAAFYAARMGVPVNRLICAANANHVLTDFINTGVYNRIRPFEQTISPSMDILISSNLERLLYELSGRDAAKVCKLMQELKEKGCYRVDGSLARQVSGWFWSDYCSDAETIETIRETWEDNQYLLDTHTAVAVNVYKKYLKAVKDKTAAIIASTASPFKFGGSVAQAIIDPKELRGQDEFEILRLLEHHTGINMPAAIKGLENRPIRHKRVCGQGEMAQAIFEFLRLNGTRLR